MPFFRRGSRTVTLPRAEALSITFTERLPNHTRTVPFGLGTAALLTRTVTRAFWRAVTFADLSFAETFTVPRATFRERAEVDSRGSQPGTVTRARTVRRAPRSFARTR